MMIGKIKVTVVPNNDVPFVLLARLTSTTGWVVAWTGTDEATAKRVYADTCESLPKGSQVRLVRTELLELWDK